MSSSPTGPPTLTYYISLSGMFCASNLDNNPDGSSFLHCIRFNPIFALPIHAPLQEDSSPTQPTTGRQTGTGSSALNLPSISAVPPSPLLGYIPVPFLTMLTFTGTTPQQAYTRYIEASTEQEGRLLSLEQIRSQAGGPVVVFVEGTTGNGRGLLRISKGLFGLEGWEVPVRRGSVWVCWFK